MFGKFEKCKFVWADESSLIHIMTVATKRMWSYRICVHAGIMRAAIA